MRHVVKFDLNVLNNAHVSVDNKFQIARLEPAWLSRHLDLEEYQISEAFLNRARRKGDICFGILINDRVAGFSWYSNKNSFLLGGDLELRFNDTYLYEYKSFIHPDYRGQRLNNIGFSAAIRELSKLGYDNIIGVVAFDNFSSLKSLYRKGAKKAAKFIFIKFYKTQRGFLIGKKKHPGFEVSIAEKQPLQSLKP